MAQRETTTVAIIGGGVSGLTAASLLKRRSVDSIILERRPREYVEERQRAGFVEYRGVRMFEEWGLDRVLGDTRGNISIEILVDGESHLVDQSDPTGAKAGRVCPQTLLVRNLIADFLAEGGDLRFGAEDVALHGQDSDNPTVTYTDQEGNAREIEAAFIAGCDGDHGVSRASVPEGAMTVYSFDHGYSWLTILANAPPPRHPLFAVGKKGYAAHFFRGPKRSRFYLGCDRDDQPADWPEARIWQQLKARLGRDDLPTGEITGIDMFPLRSLVHEPMNYGRLFLLGDAAHIISPMGAKGMNLALYDAEVFARAVSEYIQGDEAGLRSYSDTCLARTWNYQEYSRWMTETFHGACDGAEPDPFLARLAKARLNRLFTSQAAELAYTELALGLA